MECDSSPRSVVPALAPALRRGGLGRDYRNSGNPYHLIAIPGTKCCSHPVAKTSRNPLAVIMIIDNLRCRFHSTMPLAGPGQGIQTGLHKREVVVADPDVLSFAKRKSLCPKCGRNNRNQMRRRLKQ